MCPTSCQPLTAASTLHHFVSTDEASPCACCRVMGPAAAEVIAEDEKRVAAASAIIKEEELSKAMK